MLIEGQKNVLETIALGAPLQDTLDALVRLIEAQSTDMLGSILLLEPDGVRLRHGSAPSLPEAYMRAIDGAPIGESAGSCGTAAYRGELVITENIETDPVWKDYRQHRTGAWAARVLVDSDLRRSAPRDRHLCALRPPARQTVPMPTSG